MRGGVLATVAAGALALATLAASGAAARSAGCVVQGRAIAGIPHSRVLATRGATVVYRVRGKGPDAWWACRRGGTGHSFIGSDDSFRGRNTEYGPNRTISDLRLAGDWVIAMQEIGHVQYVACTKYMQYPCTGPTESLVAVKVGSAGPGTLTQFTTDTTDSSGDGTDIAWKSVLLSSAGGAAWLLRSQAFTPSSSAPAILTLYGCVIVKGPNGSGCTPVQLASGAIDPASLNLAGTTLTWTGGGQSQSASL
jgi:hypothetical protein